MLVIGMTAKMAANPPQIMAVIAHGAVVLLIL